MMAPHAGLRRVICVVALLAMSTCDGLFHFDVEIEGEGVIPAATLIDKLFQILPIEGFDRIDVSRQFQNQGVTEDDIHSVTMATFTLEVRAPEGTRFDFMESIAFFAEAEGLPRVRVASLGSIPDGATRLEMTVDPEIELKPYVTAPSMTIASEVEGSRPSEATRVHALVVLDVHADVGCN